MIGPKAGNKTKRDREMLHVLADRCLFVAAALFLGCLPLPAAAAPYSGGNGTTEAPFLISTPEDFQTMGNSPADWGKQFQLTQDIDLSGFSEDNLQMIGRWAALGSLQNQPFWGIFDGNGKTIANFHYRNMSADYVGLFQHVTGEIRDLKLVGAVVTGNRLGTGALVGCLEKGAVLRCAAVNVRVSGDASVGALVGDVEGGGAVHTSFSDGAVSGTRYVGGLVGLVGLGTVARSYSKAGVTGTESVGGLAGATSREESIVDSCYAQGDVKGDSYVAGLVGQASAGRVWRCYSTGKVTGNAAVGGLVGYQRALALVMGCLWDKESSGQTTSVGGTGQTTAEMKLMDTFLAMNWDFFDTWTICEGINYPILQWQIPPGDFVCPDGVNFLDFVWFAANWRRQNCGAINLSCDGADFDESGSVEFRDLAIFAENWLAGIE
jgi:hypothetical protein